MAVISGVVRRRSGRSSRVCVLVVVATVLAASCGPTDMATPDQAAADVIEVIEAEPASAEISRPARTVGRASPTSGAVAGGGRASDGCAAESNFEAGWHTRPWLGIERRVRVHLPTLAPPAGAPVVLNLHGASTSAGIHDALLPFSGRATERGYVVMVPEGMPPTDDVPLQVWEFLPGPYPDDTGYLGSLIDWIAEVVCIDLDRVYATGFSNGSTMANVLGCHTGGRFRAVGGVAAHRFPTDCPTGPVSVIGIHGTADPIVPYTGGHLWRRPDIWMPPVDETFESWAEAGRCEPHPSEHEVADDVVLRRWDDCASGVEVELYKIYGGAHSWPRVDHPLAPASIDATTIVLDFFDRN